MLGLAHMSGTWDLGHHVNKSLLFLLDLDVVLKWLPSQLFPQILVLKFSSILLL